VKQTTSFPKQQQLVNEALQPFNLSARDVKRLEGRDQVAVYAAAYTHYQTGDYLQAGDLFTQLIFSNPFQEKFWRGLAAARQLENKYEEALHAWGLVALLQESDPISHFHAAECLVSLGNKEEALKALNHAQELAADDALQQKIELLRERL
jgi:type III secretion system low calcium response chaperone LcrH/SycD